MTMHWLSIFYRFVPGIVASLGGAVLVWSASSQRKIQFTVAATALSLICMEWEYVVAGVFSISMVPEILGYLALTAIGLVLGPPGCLCLGICGLLFFTYVNVRYGSPYLLDYIIPVFYAILVGLCRRRLALRRPGILEVGRLEAIYLICLNTVVIWRTTTLNKWGWILGQDW
jgi:hypothetical protein